MNDKEQKDTEQLERLNNNLAKVDELSKRLVAAMARRKEADEGLQGPSKELYAKAAAAYVAEMMANPAKMVENQVSYWGKSLRHFMEAQQATGAAQTAETPATDKRFASPLWDSNPYFHFIKQQYLLNSAAIEQTVQDLEGVDAGERRRIEFFSRQIMDMFSPANFLGTNPEALERAVETDGQSLVSGLENLVRDLEGNQGDLLVTLADKEAFVVGGNIANTPGEVVFRNRMFELIQYAPTTEKAHKTPLIIFPPWINKFYILDLKPANSMVKWIVDQGFTLFVVSWVNPDASYSDVSLDTYVEEGYLTAIEQVKKITGEKQVNTVGYCIGGTTLALTLALMEKRKDTSVKSATFFTTITDFADQGEMGVFLDDDFVDGIEREVANKGFLHAFFMSRTFSFLRANDLVYAPAIRSYMMGEKPPAFDLLFWNGDATNLPGAMAVQYLRGLCQQNLFAEGGFELLGEKLLLKDVKHPVCAIACETDHIAAWKSSFDGIKQFGAKDKTFILSESGHIAGIVNPPSKKKYGHYTNPGAMQNADAWKDSADFNEGSWWGRWAGWLGKHSGTKVAARKPADSLAPAPGTYVVAKPNG